MNKKLKRKMKSIQLGIYTLVGEMIGAVIVCLIRPQIGWICLAVVGCILVIYIIRYLRIIYKIYA